MASHHQQPPTGLEDDQSTRSDKVQLQLTTILVRIKDGVQNNESSPVSGYDVETIHKCLEILRSPLAETPLIYTVLTLINQTPVGDEFVKRGCTDSTFPFSVDDLPEALDSEIKKQFLEAQNAVVTRGMRVEKGEHVISEFNRLGFEREFVLGREWIIKSAYTGKRYTLLRRAGSPPPNVTDSSVMPYKFLKELRHPHLAQLIGSFEDTKTREIGMVLSPPAEFHLSYYLRQVAEQRLEDTAVHKEKLRGFFGCLASGLDFLQRHHISSPVSPDKIFVYKGNVLFHPSYGSGYHESEYHALSVTSDDIDQGIYNQINHPRSRDAFLDSQDTHRREDIRWLGLIFLDILAALNATRLEVLCDRRIWPYNSGKWNSWKQAIQKLEKRVPLKEKVVFEWIKEMLFKIESDDPELTTRDIFLRIQAQESTGNGLSFYGRCCLQDGDQGNDILSPSDLVGLETLA